MSDRAEQLEQQLDTMNDRYAEALSDLSNLSARLATETNRCKAAESWANDAEVMLRRLRPTAFTDWNDMGVRSDIDALLARRPK